MAERRMLAKNVILQDNLADLSYGTQLLYVYLNLQADDDGFVGNPRMVVKMLQCDMAQLQELVDAGFLLQFESGILVIVHWRIHNQIRKDRYKPTRYRQELAQLQLRADGAYELAPEGGSGLVVDPVTQAREEESSPAKPSLAQLSTDEANPGMMPVAPPAADSLSLLTDFEKDVLTLYTELCPSLKRCTYLCNKTRQALSQLQKIGWTVQSLSEVFRQAEKIPFLAGHNAKGWKADLKWLCKDDNLRKVLDGRYKDFELEQPSRTIYGCNELGQAELEAIQKLLAEEN